MSLFSRQELLDALSIKGRINYLVTNGLGYQTHTNFIQGRENKLGFFARYFSRHTSEDKVKNSPEGLQAHLYELEKKDDELSLEILTSILEITPITRTSISGIIFKLLHRKGAKESLFSHSRDRAVEQVGLQNLLDKLLETTETITSQSYLYRDKRSI
ncbi:MAG: hypothetical protein AABX11_05510 [Nanoarchaeota archaeon]